MLKETLSRYALSVVFLIHGTSHIAYVKLEKLFEESRLRQVQSLAYEVAEAGVTLCAAAYVQLDRS